MIHYNAGDGIGGSLEALLDRALAASSPSADRGRYFP